MSKSKTLTSDMEEMVTFSRNIGILFGIFGLILLATQIFLFFRLGHWQPFSWLDIAKYIATSYFVDDWPRRYLLEWISRPQSWQDVHAVLGFVSAPTTLLTIAWLFFRMSISTTKQLKRGQIWE